MPAMPAPTTKRQSHGLSNALSGWLMSLPLALILFFFLLLPIVTIVIVSFWGATEYSIYPAFQFDNYEFLLTSPVTYQVFFNTVKYALITWAFTLLIGFTVAYFLAFHVRSLGWQVGLFLVCTIPFWTSIVIRMISWIPLLGRNGLVNESLVSAGLIDTPIEWLLYSDFAVALALKEETGAPVVNWCLSQGSNPGQPSPGRLNLYGWY